MERDGGSAFATALSAVGQDRKSHDLQRDADAIRDGGNSNGGDKEADTDEDEAVTVSFSVAVTVGVVLLLLNAGVFAATMCQWPRLRRRRRRHRKQRHAAALAAAALASAPVDNRKKFDDTFLFVCLFCPSVPASSSTPLHLGAAVNTEH